MAILDHMILKVNDLEASVAFYTGVLGFSAAGIAYGPTFDSVGTNTGPGEESGARGTAPTLYFNDPNKHLLEIRTYERS